MRTIEAIVTVAFVSIFFLAVAFVTMSLGGTESEVVVNVEESQ